MVIYTIGIQSQDGDPLDWAFFTKEGLKPMTFIQVPRVESKIRIPDKRAFTVSNTQIVKASNTSDDILRCKKFEVEGNHYLKVDDRFMNLGIEKVERARKGSKVNACDIVTILHPHNYDMYRYDVSSGMKIRRVVNSKTMNGFVAEVPKNLNWEVHLLIRKRDIPNGSPEWLLLEISKKKNSESGVYVRGELYESVSDVISRFNARTVSKNDMKLNINTDVQRISREIKPWRYNRVIDHAPTKYIIYRKSARNRRKLISLLKKSDVMHNGIQYELIPYEKLLDKEVELRCNSATLYGVRYDKRDPVLSKFRYIFVMKKNGRTRVLKEN